MRLQHWLATGLSFGLLLSAPALAVAEGAPAAAPAPATVALPQPCVDAKVTIQAECDALLAKQKAEAEKAAADKAAADKAAADKAAADKAAADKAATDKAAADKAAADKAAADKAAAGKAAADKAAADKGAAPAAAATPAPASATPAAANANPAPVAPAAALPAEVTPAKPSEKPAEPVAAAPALPDITSGLNAAAESYNTSVAALGKAGGNAAAADKANAAIKAARAKIDALCKTNNFETPQCLAQYGIQLSALPTTDGGNPVVAAGPAVQPVEEIRNLPKGVTQQDVAPLLDSAKDQSGGKAPAPTAAAEPAAVAPAAATNTPPPKSDLAAQAGLKPEKPVSIDQVKGQQLQAGAPAPQVQLPQNVTIVNQTVVNTTNVTNNTNNTNNTQNNSGPGLQQNNGAPAPAQPAPVNPIGLGLQVILQIGNQMIINSPAQDQRRISDRNRDQTSYEQLPNDRYRETIDRPDGSRIVTIYNRNGDVLRRSRFDHDGREVVLAYFDDSHDNDLLQWRDPAQDLPPLVLHIPARDYVLDADQADQQSVQTFFAQPPVERVQRLYSIDEVKRSSRIRDMVRRLELGDLHFDSGAATISQDQVANLSKVAGAMLQLLKKNPAETFLIEGHTDAVGSDIANLKLSDARAATVAQILTDFYQIPPENLATQGYGKRYLKVQTDQAEPLNRRVTIRRITSLVTIANN
jgi:outer membrane protein OmpA-like peptidoglycan-associated protein